jgi:hypothetical protein
LQKAKEAKACADAVIDPDMRTDWLQMAVGYYELAQMLTRSTLIEVALE